MRRLSCGGLLIESTSDLPDLRRASRLFGDFEVSSNDPKVKALDPWDREHASLCGIAAAADDSPAYYLPCDWGCKWGGLSHETVQAWWFDTISTAKLWVNHNVKYDMHISALDLGVVRDDDVLCTLTQAKLVDSDRFGGNPYGLDRLARDWLKRDISRYEEALKPWLVNTHDYGEIPIDVIADYGCNDVITVRQLDKYIRELMPEPCQTVSRVEQQLTAVLFDIERTGMVVNPDDLRVKEILIYHELMLLHSRLEQRTGRVFRPHVSEDCFEILCNQYGLPVLEWTKEEEDLEDDEERNASFNKHVLAKYAVHPFAPQDVVQDIIRYRHLNTLNNFFVKKYQERAIKHDDGVYRMHPSYNQAVRTGRLSCKNPNAMQLSEEAKELILPPPGMTILSCDDSQIEYRTIVHYTQNPRAIKAYNENPDTDFHQFVADVITETMGSPISRDPAKTCNFLMGYGGGKARLLGALSSDTTLMGGIVGYVDQKVASGEVKPEHREAVYTQLAARRAEQVYNAYHGNLPELKTVSKDVERTCRMRSGPGRPGYVQNVAGRRRHLPPTMAHIGFNAINQSLAADMMKERMVRLWHYLREHELPIKMMAQVHDDLTFIVPTEICTPELKREIAGFMEDCTYKLRVPIRVAIGVSDQNWRLASKGLKKNKEVLWPKPAAIRYDRGELRGIAAACSISHEPAKVL